MAALGSASASRLGSEMWSVGAVGIALFVVGCHAEDQWDDALCPDSGTELTYENFGESVIFGECQTCHATTAVDRKGAPAEITFDDLEEVRDWAPRIYERSAFENASMPPGPIDLDESTRAELGEWLACGAPSEED